MVNTSPTSFIRAAQMAGSIWVRTDQFGLKTTTQLNGCLIMKVCLNQLPPVSFVRSIAITNFASVHTARVSGKLHLLLPHVQSHSRWYIKEKLRVLATPF